MQSVSAKGASIPAVGLAIVRPLFYGARSDAKPATTFADHALEAELVAQIPAPGDDAAD
jgi:hypothetical protein